MTSERADAYLKADLQDTKLEFQNCISGFMKLENHQIQLHADLSMKPKVTPEQVTPS